MVQVQLFLGYVFFGLSFLGGGAQQASRALFFWSVSSALFMVTGVRVCVLKKKKDTLKGEESSAFVQGRQIILLLLLLPLSKES